MSEIGKKYDKEKPRTDLLPPLALIEVAKVLGYGADKYGPDNWKELDNLQSRYTGAALRHLLAHMAGEKTDEETNLDHLAHAMCCLLFKLEAKLQNGANQEEGIRKLNENEYRKSDFTSGPHRG
jgi:hypothetical protein